MKNRPDPLKSLIYSVLLSFDQIDICIYRVYTERRKCMEILEKMRFFGILEKQQELSVKYQQDQRKAKSKISQLTFTCSKSTIETLEKGVKYVQS